MNWSEELYSKWTVEVDTDRGIAKPKTRTRKFYYHSSKTNKFMLPPTGLTSSQDLLYR